MTEQDRALLRRYRLEQAESALSDAHLLLEHHGSNVGIVNRSYYAMFYAVLALLQDRSTVPSKHSSVITLFDVEFVKVGIFSKDRSKSLHTAFDLRQESDDKAVTALDASLANDILAEAETFVREVKQYLFPKEDFSSNP
jgi:uncharacterized protein (UPF0332 family)